MSEVLRTERLIIREFGSRDLVPLAEMLGDPETMRYYHHPFSRDEARLWLDQNRARYLADGFGLYALEERGTGAFVGDCGLAVQLVEGDPFIEIGWHVVRTRWREGFASEAATAVLAHGFGTLRLRTIVALIRPENEPSAGVARKVGMSIGREVEFHGNRHHLFVATWT